MIDYAILKEIYQAAQEDMEGAKANCGKYGGARDCSAWTDRNLRCSDCPVEVWLSSLCDVFVKYGASLSAEKALEQCEAERWPMKPN